MPFRKESHFFWGGFWGSCFTRFLLNQHDMLKKMVSSYALCVWVNYTNRQKPKWWFRPIFHTSLEFWENKKHMDENMKWSFHGLRSISRCSSYFFSPKIHGTWSNFDYVEPPSTPYEGLVSEKSAWTQEPSSEMSHEERRREAQRQTSCGSYYRFEHLAKKEACLVGWYFSKNICYIVVSTILNFHPCLGRWSNLTSIYFKWVETTN